MLGEFHPIKVVTHPISVEHRPEGVQIIRSQTELADYARCLTDRLVYWADTTPDTVFVAQRNAQGEWDKVTYAQALSRVKQLASWLLQQPVSTERPIVFFMRQ
jgi:feruloyl-CoA synthase